MIYLPFILLGALHSVLLNSMGYDITTKEYWLSMPLLMVACFFISYVTYR